MMNFKFPIFLIAILSLGSCVLASAKTVKSIDLLYSGGIDNFKQIQLSITPFNKALYFTSIPEDERYSLDCTGGEKPLIWECTDTCGSGTVKIEFSQEKGFGEFQLAKLKVRPRKCDGTEDVGDPWVESKKALSFSLTKSTYDFKLEPKTKKTEEQ